MRNSPHSPRQSGKRRSSIALWACLIAVSGSFSQDGATIRKVGYDTPTNPSSQNARLQDELSPELVTLLEMEQNIAKPFAWGLIGGIEEKYIVVGIDRDGRLKTVILAKRGNSYQVVRSGPHAERQDALITNSGSLRLAELQTDSEFPFKSEVFTVRNCKVHFVFSWRALNRSFRKGSFLTGIDVRIVIEENSKIISNEACGFSFAGFQDPFEKDINRDGNQEVVFVGIDNSKHVYLWTLNPDCSVKPILFEFEEEGSLIRENSVSGRELFLRTDPQNGNENVHTRWSEPYFENGKTQWRVTEDVYKWDSREELYRRAGKSRWLRPGD